MTDNHDPDQKSSPFPLSRLSPRYELVDLAKEIQEADALLGTVVAGKLDVIADQIRALQKEAHRLMKEAELSSELHRALCNFKKRPGAIYHLYERPQGTSYFSMLSPAEWGDAAPHGFRGSFRLELDMSFTRVDERDEP